MPNSSRPSRIPGTNATPNSRNGSATTSIPTPTTPKGSPRKLPPSPKLGLGSPPANARDAANPRPSPDAYLDRNNGLLLNAMLDALFDKFLVSFDDDGEILVSPTLLQSEYKLPPLDGLRL